MVSASLGRVLVLGGAGLVGRALAERARDAGATHVTVADRRPVEGAGLSFVEAELTESCSVARLIDERDPDLVLNAVNLATVFSAQREAGYSLALRFQAELFDALARRPRPITFLQIGTTGSGGLGFDIPFTHGGRLEDRPIIHKAAFAGIMSQLLWLTSRSFSPELVRVMEVKPGLAIFDPLVSIEDVGDAKLVTADGGESGAYTRDELALLTRFMGYTTPAGVADAVFAVLAGEAEGPAVGHDMTAAIEAAVLGATAADRLALTAQLDEMARLGGADVVVAATGNLGPPSITRDLIVAAALVAGEPSTGPRVRACLGYLARTRPTLGHWLESEDLEAAMRALEPHARAAQSAWEVVYGSLRPGR